MPRSKKPVSEKQLAANRANAARSTGPRSADGKARSARNSRKHGFAAADYTVVRIEDRQAVANLKADLVAVYRPVNSQELFALERVALAQHQLLLTSRLEAGLLTRGLNEVLHPLGPEMKWLTAALTEDVEVTTAQNRNYALAEGFHLTTVQGNAWTLFLRYQAQAERHYRRAIEEFERLKALRPELPNEPIFEPEPEPKAATSAPSETNPIPSPTPFPAPTEPSSLPERQNEPEAARYTENKESSSLPIRTFCRLAAQAQMLPALESGEETLVGGQAVMEGVMMRAPHSFCVSVRRPGGEIVYQEAPLAKLSDRHPIFKVPGIRGLGSLGQAMALGIRSLRFSANVAIEQEDPEKKPQEISSWVMTLNLVFSLAFFIFLYKFVPLWLTTRLQQRLPEIQGRIAFNLVDGIIRIAIFLGFLWLISQWKDIRRVFEYHGAEHKVVFNFESGRPLTVENAQKFQTFHPRCGTSFLLVVMMISIVVYALVPVDTFALRMISRVALLPVIAGVSFEIIRYAAKRRGSLMAAMTAPGLWLQRITTRPPSDDQAEVAIHALNRAMELEKAQGGELVIA
jgi:uncharacterized protein YqhQ